MVVLIVREKDTKTSIIEAAARLFAENGYSNTSIDDICNEVGVAHSLFYYYFDSKEAVIEEIIEKTIKEMEDELVHIMEDSELNAEEKFLDLINTAFQAKLKKPFFGSAVSIVDNPELFFPLYCRQVKMMSTYLTKIVEKGIDEGVFDTDYPEETIKFWLYGRLFLTDELKSGTSLYENMMAGASILERLLGAKNDFLTSVYEEYEDDVKNLLKETLAGD